MVALDLIDMSAVVAELAEVSFLTVTSDIELFAVPVDAESASIESSFESVYPVALVNVGALNSMTDTALETLSFTVAIALGARLRSRRISTSAESCVHHPIVVDDPVIPAHLWIGWVERFHHRLCQFWNKIIIKTI